MVDGVSAATSAPHTNPQVTKAAGTCRHHPHWSLPCALATQHPPACLAAVSPRRSCWCRCCSPAACLLPAAPAVAASAAPPGRQTHTAAGPARTQARAKAGQKVRLRMIQQRWRQGAYSWQYRMQGDQHGVPRLRLFPWGRIPATRCTPTSQASQEGTAAPLHSPKLPMFAAWLEPLCCSSSQQLRLQELQAAALSPDPRCCRCQQQQQQQQPQLQLGLTMCSSSC
jgi:hypothetical protein